MEQPTDQSLVRTAKTVEEAIELATLELGVGRDEIEVDVLNPGRAGILGIGAEPATVRVRLIGDDSGLAGEALDVVERLLDALDVDASPTIRSAEPGQPPVIDVQGHDAGLLIGRRGETLRALQFVANLILNQGETRSAGVVVDVEQYRQRRERQLRDLAQRMAQRAVNNGSSISLEPMSPADRRIIHVALADVRGVRTESHGEGSHRAVTITPTGEARPSSGGDRGGRRRRRYDR